MLPEGVSETVQNEAKEQRGGFLNMLLGTLGVSLLGYILRGKKINRAGEEILIAGYANKKGRKMIIKRQDHEKQNGFVMPPYPLTNFEIQKYYQNEPRFKGVYSSDNLPKRKSFKVKDEANLYEYSDIGTHWIALYAQNNHVTYFAGFGVEHIPKEIGTFIGNKNIKT